MGLKLRDRMGCMELMSMVEFSAGHCEIGKDVETEEGIKRLGLDKR